MNAHFDIPIALTNDAKAAVGEKLFGGAKKMENFILITLGAGLGSGIYTHGHLLTGNLGLAGEMGHMIMETYGRMCNKTKRMPGILCFRYRNKTYNLFSVCQICSGKFPLRNFSFKDLEGQQISIAARNGDPIALEAFEFTAQILGKALANVISLFDPEAIFVGEGLARR